MSIRFIGLAPAEASHKTPARAQCTDIVQCCAQKQKQKQEEEDKERREAQTQKQKQKERASSSPPQKRLKGPAARECQPGVPPLPFPSSSPYHAWGPPPPYFSVPPPPPATTPLAQGWQPGFALSQAPVFGGPSGTWACSMCTLRNREHNLACDACCSPRCR